MPYTMEQIVDAIKVSTGGLGSSYDRDQWLAEDMAERVQAYLLRQYSDEAIAERKAREEVKLRNKEEELQHWFAKMQGEVP